MFGASWRALRRVLQRPQWIGPVAVLGIWLAASTLGVVNPTLLPSPLATIAHLWHIVSTLNIARDFTETMARMAIGYSVAALVGIPVGILLGASRRVYASMEVVLEFFRSLPVTTLYPLFVLLFGIGHESKIAMVIAACVFVVALNSAYGVMHASQARIQVARVFGASRWQVFRDVIFFESLPQTIIGLRVAISYALIVEVVCEMFMGAQRGIGQRVFEAYNTYDTVELYAIILLVGLTGYAINKLFASMERFLIPWVGR